MLTVGMVTKFVRNGATLKQQKGCAGIPVTRIETLSNGVFNYDRLGFADVFDDSYSKYYLEKHDVLLSHINSEKFLGRSVLYVPQKDDEKIIHGMNLLCLRFDSKKYNPAFFCWYTKSSLAKDFFRIHTKHAVNQASIPSSVIKEMPIPDIDLIKQKDIVLSLDRIQKSISEKQGQLEFLDCLVKSRFMEMFGDVTVEQKNTIKLGSICKTMGGGTPTTKKPEYYEGNIPWISTVSLGPNYIDGSDAKGYITNDAIINSATKLIPAYSVMVGTRVGVGKSSVNTVPICTNQDINSITGLDSKKYIPLFIKYVVDAYQSYFDSIKKGATILGINSDDLKNINVPNVSIGLQKEFVSFVELIDKSRFVCHSRNFL